MQTEQNYNPSLRTHVLGFPRIGAKRELKKSCEHFWNGKISEESLLEQGRAIRKSNWEKQKALGIDLIPSNDFSFYDQVLDMTLMLGAIPQRYQALTHDKIALYFAMARGIQKGENDVIAMEMTKWFDSNYHYIVPEFTRQQSFSLFDDKVVREFIEAKDLGIITKPVLLGPITYLLLGKEKEEGFHKIELLDQLLPTYIALLQALEKAGAEWIQIDEPFITLNIDEKIKQAYQKAFQTIQQQTNIKVIFTTYFEGLKENTHFALNLPYHTLHIDLVRDNTQLEHILPALPAEKSLSLGLIDGRNIWKSHLHEAQSQIQKAINHLGKERVLIAGSSSFLHVPYDLQLETKEDTLPSSIKRWLAFAWQKVEELAILKDLNQDNPKPASVAFLEANQQDIVAKQNAAIIHNATVKARVANISPSDAQRTLPYSERRKIQALELGLPLFPTTTIGSFPQTQEVRQWRAQFKKQELSGNDYENKLKEATKQCIAWQEEIGLDVLVHGEFERNDMVEYFGEQLEGFVFTQNGWVQSYGSRCVKPPIIFGDISRKKAMTVDWSSFAQSLTTKPVKGMLTGPVTILQWSFVRNDQPRSTTCQQIALAIRDEVTDLEKAGIKIIQIDEPAIREGLPLRKEAWKTYLQWAVNCFCIASSGVKDATQIHTHMCYSEFNEIIEAIAAMDADVISIECSRSQMEIFDVFKAFKYPNEIGLGVYDIHSARVPKTDEMLQILYKASELLNYQQLWLNPDCGLKTRQWAETKEALIKMVEAAQTIRKKYSA